MAAVEQWADAWSGIDAMEVVWRVQRDRYTSDMHLLESTWFIETTLYRWPDSFRRWVEFDVTRNREEGVATELYDERLVEEGILPNGTHVRRYTGLGRSDIMTGPRLLDALHRECVRAPFLLARWVQEYGLGSERFAAVHTGDERVAAVAPSIRLGFELARVDGDWALARVTILSDEAVEFARFELGDYARESVLPGPIARFSAVSVRGRNGEFVPGESLEMIHAEPVAVPSDEELWIETERDERRDTRSLQAQSEAGVENPALPPQVRSPPRSLVLPYVVGACGVLLIASGISWWWWRRREGARAA